MKETIREPFNHTIFKLRRMFPNGGLKKIQNLMASARELDVELELKIKAYNGGRVDPVTGHTHYLTLKSDKMNFFSPF